jgi:hypothetical protein
MSGVRLCVICQRPLDDGRKRRADAVTCGASCRTLLWRARRRIRRDGGVPSLRVDVDGYGSLVSFEPPARRPWSQSDDRFHSQAALQDQGAIEITRAERDHMRRNVGVMHPAVSQRLTERELHLRACEAESYRQHNPIKPETPLDPSSLGSVARRGIESRRANRPVDPYERMLSPGRQPGPSRYPGEAMEAEMMDAPWGAVLRGHRSAGRPCPHHVQHPASRSCPAS